MWNLLKGLFQRLIYLDVANSEHKLTSFQTSEIVESGFPTNGQPQVCAIISAALSLNFVNPYAPMPKMWPAVSRRRVGLSI